MEGKVLWVNDTFEHIFGYSSQECLNQSLDTLLAPDERHCNSYEFQSQFTAGTTSVVEETQRIRKDGQIIHVSISATPIHDESGACHTCYHYIDISKRVKAKRHASALHEISHAINSTQNLQELYSSIHIALGRLIDTTNFFIALYDKPTDQIRFVYYTDVAEEVGKEIEVIEHASQAKGSYTARVIFGEKPILLTTAQIAKDFSSEDKPIGPIAQSWLGVPLCIKQNVIGAVAVQSYTVHDTYDENDIEILESVTEQIAIAIETKRTEQELVESEILHKSLFNQGVDAILVHDLNGRILKANDVALARFGYSERELLAMSMEDICVPHTTQPLEDDPRVSDDGNSYHSETLQRTQSGHEIVSELHGTEIHYKGQKAILCSARDITEKKAREEEKRALEQKLSRAQTMQALGQLAGGVAHDLNNILSGVTSYPELLLLKLPEESPLRKPLETIKKSGFRAAEIVEDMLTLTRLGKRNDSVISLNRSIEEFLASPEYLKLKNEHSATQVNTAFNDALLNIKGSEVHLSKMLLNLLKNGFEAISGNGRIRLETDNSYISTQTGNHDRIPEGEYVALHISDSGIGIPANDIENIFEPFYTTKKMGSSGTGLGMAIVWRTVKDHKGYIDVTSPKGDGTTFSLYFPATREKRIESQQRSTLSDYSGNGELIYVVDDVSEQRLIASAILKELGYRVRTFKSGEDVLGFLHAKNEYPDLFLLDMIMEPGIDGVETFNNICAMTPNPKALIASGFSKMKQVKAASKIGVGQHLRKPYTIENLAQAVKKVLSRNTQQKD